MATMENMMIPSTYGTNTCNVDDDAYSGDYSSLCKYTTVTYKTDVPYLLCTAPFRCYFSKFEVDLPNSNIYRHIMDASTKLEEKAKFMIAQ